MNRRTICFAAVFFPLVMIVAMLFPTVGLARRRQITHMPPPQPMTVSKVFTITVNHGQQGNSGSQQWKVIEDTAGSVQEAWYTAEANIDQLPRFKAIVVSRDENHKGSVLIKWQGDNKEATLDIHVYAVYIPAR